MKEEGLDEGTIIAALVFLLFYVPLWGVCEHCVHIVSPTIPFSDIPSGLF